MIISKTPFRISFFGGGTDYPAWFNKHEGAVLATTMDKYCYISCRYLPPFFEHKSRIIYSVIETVKAIDEIKHPSVRECLKFMNVKEGVEIHHDGDLPARTGLGSSSSFTVGLLNALYALKGQIIAPEELARNAINVEQEWTKETVGCQDQVMAAIGGFNLIEFKPDQGFRVQPVSIRSDRLELLQSHLLLIFTGFTRLASKIARHLTKRILQKENELNQMRQMVYEGLKILNGNNNINEFGKLLHKSWRLKRSLTDKITTPALDQIYERAMALGALGGKILGAGGGGFLLLFAKPELHPKIKEGLKDFLHVPFRFENAGSQIVYYKPDENSLKNI